MKRLLLWLMIGVSISVPIASACSWSYSIWAIRGKSADPLFRFVRYGKVGYIDAKAKIIVPPTFPASDNFGGEFHEGLLGVRDEKGYRFVDRSGKTVLRADVWLVSNFSEGLAAASKNDRTHKWGFIDRDGTYAVAPQYRWVDPFSEGLARVSVSSEVGSTGYIDRQGKFAIPPRLSYGSSFHEGLAAVIIGGPCQIVNGGSCGRAEFRPMKTNPDYDCRWAFVDKGGQPISDLRFEDAKDFSEGLAPVRIGQKWGFVDKSGQIAISPQFDSAEEFSEGLAAVARNQKTGFIDHSGSFVIDPEFTSVGGFSDGRALVGELSGGAMSYRFIDKTGKAAFRGTFAAAGPFGDGLAPVAYQLESGKKGTFAWIDTTGTPVFTYSVQ